MKNAFIFGLFIIALCLIAFVAWQKPFSKTQNTYNPDTMAVPSLQEDLASIPENAQVATFSGGCFWCIEQAFDGQAGVYAAISGYAGGTEEDAEYKKVAYGQTDHRETAQVHYDPEQLSYEDLLEIFWRQIDPTDAGGQFADRGHHYTTAIYYHNDEQKVAAETSKKILEESGKFDSPIVTEIVPYTAFYPAEEEHQNYARKQAEHYKQYKTGSGRAGFIEENWEK